LAFEQCISNLDAIVEIEREHVRAPHCVRCGKHVGLVRHRHTKPPKQISGHQRTGDRGKAGDYIERRCVNAGKPVCRKGSGSHPFGSIEEAAAQLFVQTLG
jgi:hypothetical protein